MSSSLHERDIIYGSMPKKHATIHRQAHKLCTVAKVFYCPSLHSPRLRRHGRERRWGCGAAGQDRKRQAGREQRSLCDVSAPCTQGTWWVSEGGCKCTDRWRIIRVPRLSFDIKSMWPDLKMIPLLGGCITISRPMSPHFATRCYLRWEGHIKVSCKTLMMQVFLKAPAGSPW